MTRASHFQNYIDLVSQHDNSKCHCQGQDEEGNLVDPSPDCELGTKISEAWKASRTAPEKGMSLTVPRVESADYP
jgi:hypothetical protein